MKRFIGIPAILAAVVLGGFRPADTPRKVENFKLKDYNGVEHSLTDYKDAKGVVLMFIATRCPISNSYNERMVALDKDYRSKGIVFIGINANKQEPVDEVKQHAKDKGFEFTILKDEGNVIADKLGASVTPEIYLLNPGFEVLYHGRIDDSSKEAKVTSQDLRRALDEFLAGKVVSTPETKAFGCTIKRVTAS
ncbi:MAG TPA: thioredoxin family protein [Bacteroidota bacterium]|nr:thioredoxin family protein [Bacteroidota bacterium]